MQDKENKNIKERGQEEEYTDEEGSISGEEEEEEEENEFELSSGPKTLAITVDIDQSSRMISIP